MAEPIYKFFMARFLEPWYQLSQEEQKGLIANLDDALKKVGGKRPILCDSSWSFWSMVACWSRGIPDHRGGPEVHGGPSGVKLVPTLRGYERVGH
jgi:hypothetical protein